MLLMKLAQSIGTKRVSKSHLPINIISDATHVHMILSLNVGHNEVDTQKVKSINR